MPAVFLFMQDDGSSAVDAKLQAMQARAGQWEGVDKEVVESVDYTAHVTPLRIAKTNS